jgi:hypothetical protein
MTHRTAVGHTPAWLAARLAGDRADNHRHAAEAAELADPKET